MLWADEGRPATLDALTYAPQVTDRLRRIVREKCVIVGRIDLRCPLPFFLLGILLLGLLCSVRRQIDCPICSSMVLMASENEHGHCVS